MFIWLKNVLLIFIKGGGICGYFINIDVKMIKGILFYSVLFVLELN